MIENIYKTFFGIIAACLFIVPTNAQTTVAGFTDVTTETRYNDAVAYVEAEGIVDGYSDGTFKPDTAITRGQFVKIIINSVYDQATIDSCIQNDQSLSGSANVYFSDVLKTDVFAKYVCVAKVNSVVNGYSDGTFRMDELIPLTQASKILVRAMLNAQVEGNIDFETYIEILAELNAIPAQIVDKERPITRLQMAELIYRLRTENWDRDRALLFYKSAPTVQLDESFDLNTRQLVRIDGTRSFVRFIRVTEDSRCPEGTTCVWQGQAKLLVLYFDLDTKRFGTFELIMDESNSDLARYGFGGYVFVANSLSQGLSSSDGSGYVAYRANLTVSRMIR